MALLLGRRRRQTLDGGIDLRQWFHGEIGGCGGVVGVGKKRIVLNVEDLSQSIEWSDTIVE